VKLFVTTVSGVFCSRCNGFKFGMATLLYLRRNYKILEKEKFVTFAILREEPHLWKILNEADILLLCCMLGDHLARTAEVGKFTLGQRNVGELRQ